MISVRVNLPDDYSKEVEEILSRLKTSEAKQINKALRNGNSKLLAQVQARSKYVTRGNLMLTLVMRAVDDLLTCDDEVEDEVIKCMVDRGVPMGAPMAASKAAAKALALAKCQGSGITSDHAKELKLTGLTAEQVQALDPKFHGVAALHIPYFDFNGKTTAFYRLRYLEDLPGFAGQAEKPQRYVQAPGTMNEVYLPPLLTEGWAAVANDPTVAVYITEGELKAAAATGQGLPTIGLGGVDVWRSAKRGVELLPQLAAFKWNNREVVIVFDSDAATNPNVVRAQCRLASELVALGAVPKIAALPGQAGQKVGLDDYLVSEGADALVELVRKAPAYAEGSALWAMNEEVIYVKDPGIIIERSGGRRISVPAFTQHAYANRHYMAQTVTAAGKVTMKKEPLAPKWVEWEHRSEVDKIVYEPGKPRLHSGCWNAWEGWGVEAVAGDVKLWSALLDYVFPGQPLARKWFEQWVAYPIQHPGTKLYTSVLLWSPKHGVGKSLLAYMIMSVYGTQNAAEITSENLRSSFNAWAENKQFVVGDEITAGDSRLDKDKLKGIVTRPTVRINQKYMPEYVIRDCINYLFTSNSPDALFVEDFDRRYFVQEIVGDPLPRNFYEDCDIWLRGTAGANLLAHLRGVDLAGFNPREHAFVTPSKRSMIYVGKSDLGMFVAELKEDPEPKLRVLGEQVAKNCDLFTPGNLLRCYDPDGSKRVTAAGMAREMIRAGFRPLNGGSPVRYSGGVARLYAVRHQDEWVTKAPKQMAEHYDQKFISAQQF